MLAQTQATPDAGTPTAAPSGTQTASTPMGTAQSIAALPGKRQLREAEDAYLAGARKLQRDDLAGAEQSFAKALNLNPASAEYATALTVARQHRVTELVQQSSRARLTGQAARAETLLAQAQAIDPTNPLVLEHLGGPATGGLLAQNNAPASGDALPDGSPRIRVRTLPVDGLSERSRMLGGDGPEPWKVGAPLIAGAIELAPAGGAQPFHLRGDSQEALRQVTGAFGIKAVFDESVERKNIRFDLDHASYPLAMNILMTMAHVFAVPLDAKTVLFAKDDVATRAERQPLMEETIFLPGKTIEQINDLANVVRNVFEVKQVVVQTGLQSMVLRAPEETIGPMNEILSELMDGGGEVLLDVKFYEIDTTRVRNVGATLPTGGGIYSVDAAATQLVNANQSLVQQAIAQGFVSATASNIDIALALIASGLVQSSLLSSTIGFFGHGVTLTGITANTSTAFSLALNSSDTRTIDDVQTRVDDRQQATFRSGSKYPITTAKYTTGLSTLPAGAASATINGVTVASLLQQFAGGSSATVPQVTYEDLGITLKTTPTMEKSGRISLQMDLKIEALTGSSSNGIPVLNSRAVTSTLTVADGESALLVSNLTGTETAAVTGQPGLSELPGFEVPTDKNAERDTSQLVLLVTPHVVRRRSNMIAGPQIVVRAQDPVN